MSSTIITTFGSLTSIKTGRKVNFADFDKDGDKKISEQEYNSVLNELGLDRIDIKKVDTDGDNTISQLEFAYWEQKVNVQTAINQKLAQLSADTSLSAEDKATVQNQLTNYMNDYIDSYKGQVSKMSANFISQLDVKYNDIINNLEKSKINEQRDSVIESIKKELITRINTKANSDNDMVDVESMRTQIVNDIITKLTTVADTFIANYTGTSLENDLGEYLRNYLQKSDKDRLNEKASDTINRVSGLTEDSDEDGSKLKALKEDCTEIFKNAIEENIIINFKGYNICTESAIKYILAQYTDYNSLLNDIKSALESVSTKSNEDKMIDSGVSEAEKAAISRFVNMRGSEYKVYSDKIDYTTVIKKFYDDYEPDEEGGMNKDYEIHESGKGWSGSRDAAYDKGMEILQSDELKSQFKKQIEEKVQAYGIPYSKVASIVENVYNQCAIDTLNSEEMITGRGARGLSSKGHAYINISKMLNTFTDKFNVAISNAIDDMNASQTDFDKIDIDFSKLGDGCAEHGENFAELYYQQKLTTVEDCGPNYYVEVAAKLLNTIKPQILSKAKAMAKANNVEFDQDAFDKMFGIAMESAIQAAVKGTDEDGVDYVGSLKSLGDTSLQAIIGPAYTIVRDLINGENWKDVVKNGLYASALAAAVTIGISTGPVGWIALGVGAVGKFLYDLFSSSDPSTSTLDTNKLVNTFLKEFEKQYNVWINNAPKNNVQ